MRTKRIFIVTGAYGFLGNTLCRMLSERKETVRALVLTGETCPAFDGFDNITVYQGDVCKKETLEELFVADDCCELYLIHTAAVVSIDSVAHELTRRVNLEGARNIAELALKHHVTKMVYVSSVHAIPENPVPQLIEETNHFNPNAVVGDYAKTKAEATRMILGMTRRGLHAIVVHPSGILGPYDYGLSHLTQFVTAYYSGALRVGVNGHYNFVDVRDVAAGCLLAAEKGRIGQCYILSNQVYSVRELLDFLQNNGAARVNLLFPLWAAKLIAPLAEFYSRKRQRPTLVTQYSIHTLGSNANFSHQKASRELGYQPRSIQATLSDMTDWLKESGRI